MFFPLRCLFKCAFTRLKLAGLFSLLFLIIFTFCSKKSDHPAGKEDQILARIGNEVITVDEFSRNYETGFGNLKTGEDRKGTYLNYMINERLLALEGYRLGLDKSERVKTRERRLLNELLIETLLNKEVRSKVKVTPDEIRQEINKAKVSFKFRYWTEDNLQKAEEVVRDMRQRGYAAVVDDLLNRNPEKHINPRKFETRYLTYMEISSELLDAIKDLPVGEISDPVLLHGKYYIFQVLDIRRSAVTENEYKSKASSFEQIIFYRKYQQAIARYVSNLMEPRQVVTRGDAFGLLAKALQEWQEAGEEEGDDFLRAVLKSDSHRPAMKNLKDHLDQVIVAYADGSISLKDFLKEFNPLRLNDKEYDGLNFNARLARVIKLAIRDHFLAEEAKKMGLQEDTAVRKTLARWRNKWVFEETRDYLTRKVNLSEEEVKRYFETHRMHYKLSKNANPQLAGFLKKARRDALRDKERQILIEKIEELKKEYPVEINRTILDTLRVIDFRKSRWATFQVFQMGTNRPASPVVDPAWGE